MVVTILCCAEHAVYSSQLIFIFIKSLEELSLLVLIVVFICYLIFIFLRSLFFSTDTFNFMVIPAQV